jgi:Ca2+-binding EF-hand superfamily protein
MTHIKKIMMATAASTLLAGQALAGDARSFTQIDADASGDVTFTEFYNAYQGKGMSDVDLAMKFSKMTDGKATFTADDYQMAKSAWSQDAWRQDTGSTAMISAASVDSRAAASGNFSDYDANADGMVSFAEYSKAARKMNGLSATAAAQQFIRITEGGQSFDRSQFDIAMMTNAPARAVYKSQPADVTQITPTYTSSVSVSQAPTTLTTPRIVDGAATSSSSAIIVETPEVAIDTDLTTGTTLNMTESSMTNSGTETDMDATGNPQMKVWGKASAQTDIMN